MRPAACACAACGLEAKRQQDVQARVRKGDRGAEGEGGACFKNQGGRVWARSCNVQARVREGGEQRVERTQNMYHMLLTLDVLKLSGWLNAYACCRVEREA